MKITIKRIVQAGVPVVSSLAFSVAAYAEEVDLAPITDPLDNLYTMFSSIISVVGGIVALFFFVQMMAGLNSHDSTQQVMSILKFATALVIALAPWILKYVLGI